MRKASLGIVLFLMLSACTTGVVRETATQHHKPSSITTNESGGIEYHLDNRRYVNYEEAGKKLFRVDELVLSDIEYNPGLSVSESSAFIIKVENLNKDYLSYLESVSIRVGDYIYPDYLIVKADKNLRQMKRLKQVKDVYCYQPFMKISLDSLGDKASWEYRVRLWDEKSREDFVSFCQSNHIEVKSSYRDSMVIAAEDIKTVLFHEEVLKAERVYTPHVFSVSGNEVKDFVFYPQTMNSDDPFMTAKVSVFDVGVDAAHPDLQGNLGQVYETAGDNDPGEFSSHGTHIAGIIAGQGLQSGGLTKGVNPVSRVDFYALGDTLKGLVIPLSLERYFLKAQQNGANIINLSWGTYDDELKGKYLSISRDIDRIIYENPGIIVMTAVGNNGKSIASPATAKNVIAVGALDGDSLAAYSGKNNTYDGRTKPELVVQGSGIRSLGVNGVYESHNGTSQATAIVSGIVSLLKPALEQYNIDVTHSLVKAFLVANTTRDKLNGYGYGKLYSDRPLTDKHYYLAQNDDLFKTLYCYVEAGDTLTLTLSWTDPATGESSVFQLVNDYDLQIVSPSGEITYLNDHINNTEKMVITNTEAGKYDINVIKRHTPFAVRDISLVVKSDQGFRVTGNEDNLLVQKQESVDSGTQDNDQSTENGTQNTGLTQDESGDTSGVTDSGTITVSQIPAHFSTGDTSAVLSRMSVASEEESLEPVVLQARPGSNELEVRFLGEGQDRFVAMSLDGDGITDSEKIYPLLTGINTEYSVFPYVLSGQSGEITGNIYIKDQDSGQSNAHPLIIRLDNQAPVIGEKHPREQGILSNSTAWVRVQDESGSIDPDMLISLNGRMLQPGEYFYHPGRSTIDVYLDRIVESSPMPGPQAVTVRFLQIKDSAGNAIPEESWHFNYVAAKDDNPPAVPTGLDYSVSNGLLTLRWDTNAEADLAGYRVYKVSSDFFDTDLVSPGILFTNTFEMTVKQIDRLGVSALDASSNESELAVISVDYRKENYPPLVAISGIPRKTNGNVSETISFMDDGYFVLTNIRLIQTNDAYTRDLSRLPWASNSLTFTETESGDYLLFVEVMDDDSNRVTNSLYFSIDKNAPDRPEGIQWTVKDKDIYLDWQAVYKDGQECGYIVRVDGEYVPLKGVFPDEGIYLPHSYAGFDREDYGQYTVSISAVDSLGNASAENSVEINTATGLSWKLSQTICKDTLALEAHCRVPQTNADSLRLVLSGPEQKYYDLPPYRETSHQIDVSALPDGEYTMELSVYKNGLKQREITSLSTNITIDNNAPVIRISDGKKEAGGNMFVTSSGEIFINASDPHLLHMDIRVNGGGVSRYPGSNAVLPVTEDTRIEVIALDSLGNISEKNLLVIFDREKPRVQVSGVGTSVTGEVFDSHLDTYRVWVNGEAHFQSSFNISGDICPAPKLQGKEQEIRILAMDLAGNSNEVVWTTNTSTISQSSNILSRLLVNGEDRTYINTHRLLLSYEGATTDPVQYLLWQGGELILQSGPVTGQDGYMLYGPADGDYRLQVQAPSARLGRDIVIDTIAPLISVMTNSEKDRMLKDIVQVEDKHLLNVTYTLSGDAATDDTLLRSGFHDLSVRAEDKAGNVSSWNARVYVSTNQNEILAAHFQYVEDGGYYNKPVSLDIQQDADEVLTHVNGYEHSGQLEYEGAYRVKVEAVKRGITNRIYTNSALVTLDFTLPHIITHLENGQITKDLPFVVVEDLNKDKTLLYIDGEEWEDTPLFIGDHILKAVAIDKAANTNIIERSFTYDNTAPLITMTPGYVYRQELKPVITVEDLTLEESVIKINSQSFTPGTAYYEEGEYEVFVYAKDKAGNINAYSEKYVVDRSAPLISVNIREGYTYGTNLIPDVVITEDYLSNSVVRLDGLIYSNTAIQPGEHVLEVQAEDLAGNNALLTRVFKTSEEVPSLKLDGLASTYYAGKYYSPENYSLTAGVDKGSIETMTVTLNGQVTNASFSIEADGEYTVHVEATAAMNGNSYPLYGSYVLVLDGNGPEVSVNGIRDGGLYDTLPFVDIDIEDHIKTKSVTLNGEEKTGSFSITRDGQYSLEVKATDVLDREAEETLSFIIDRKAPVLTLHGVEDGGIYNQSLSYAVLLEEDNLTVLDVRLNGEAIPATGYIHESGMYHMSVRAEDIMGRAVSQELTFTIDKNMPVIAVSNYVWNMNVAELSPIPYISIIDMSTRSFEVDITKDSASYRHYDLSNRTEFPLDMIEEEGNYGIAVKVIDLAGNLSTTNFSIKIDGSLPVITVAGITNGGVYPAQVNISVSVEDSYLKEYSVTLNGTEESNTITVIPDGVYALIVNAVDDADNSVTLSNSFVIDRVYPVFTVQGVTNNSFYSNARDITVDTHDVYYRSYVIRDYGPGWDNYYTHTRDANTPQTNARALFNAPEHGTHILSVSVMDLAGNTSTGNISYTVDTVKPVLQIQGANDGDYVSAASLTLSVVTFDDNPHITEAWLDGVWQADLANITAAGDGQHQVIAYSRDIVSNEIWVTNTFTLDTVPPVITLTGVSNGLYYNTDRTIDITLSDNNIDTVGSRVIYNGVTLTPATGPGVMSYSWTETNEQTFHTIDILLMDLASNTVSSIIDYSLDKTAPLITVTRKYTNFYVTDEDVAITANDEAGGSGIDILSNYVSVNSGVSNTGGPGLYTTQGDYQIHSKAIDRAGNLTVSNTHFYVDTTAPGVTYHNGSIIDATTNEDFVIDVDIDDDIRLKFVELYIDGVLLTNIVDPGTASQNISFTRTYAEWGFAAHDIRIVAEDMVGHRTDQTTPFMFVDQIKPTLNLEYFNISPNFTSLATNILGDNQDYAVEFSGVDKFGIKDFNISVNPLSPIILTNPLEPVVHFIGQNNEEKEFLVSITIEDSNGNVSTFSYTFVVDKKPPTVSYGGILQVNGPYNESPGRADIAITVSDNYGLQNGSGSYNIWIYWGAWVIQEEGRQTGGFSLNATGNTAYRRMWFESWFLHSFWGTWQQAHHMQGLISFTIRDTFGNLLQVSNKRLQGYRYNDTPSGWR